jgi:hypothetical protein
LLGDGGASSEKSCGEKLYWADLEQPRQDKKSLVPARRGKGPTREGPLSFVLHKSPFASVSTSGEAASVCVVAFPIDNCFRWRRTFEDEDKRRPL